MLTLVVALSGFVFHVPAGGKECFEEHAHASDHVSGQWNVKFEGSKAPSASQQSGWHVAVTSPANDLVYSVDAQTHGSFDYYATTEGTYTICFSNAHSESGAQGTAKITIGDPPDLVQLAKTEHLSPIEERIKNLHESMNAVRGTQLRVFRCATIWPQLTLCPVASRVCQICKTRCASKTRRSPR